MPLFWPEELRDHLQHDVSDEHAAAAERMAAGWLKGATGLDVLPDPPAADLWAWAVELAALAYSNPEGLVSESIGGGESAATYDRLRRDAILAQVRRVYGVDAVRGGPRGSFPPAQPWPDPACARSWWTW